MPLRCEGVCRGAGWAADPAAAGWSTRPLLLRSVRPPPLGQTEPTPRQAPVSMTVRTAPTATAIAPERLPPPPRHDSSPTIRPLLTPQGELIPFPPPAPVVIPPPPGLPDFDDSVAGDVLAEQPSVRAAPPPLRFSWIVLVIVFALLAMAAMAWATFAVARASRDNAIVRTMQIRPRHAAPRFRSATPKVVTPPPVIAETPKDGMGILKMPASTSSNRLWFDRKLIGNGGNDREVPCGRHLVKIGSRGREHVVDVPCGGDVAITR